MLNWAGHEKSFITLGPGVVIFSANSVACFHFDEYLGMINLVVGIHNCLEDLPTNA